MTFQRLCVLSVALWLGLSSAGLGQEADVRSEWRALNQGVVSAYRDGDYRRAAELADEALALAEAAFGETHPQTLTSLKNMAALYDAQGRYGEAEPLYARALAGSRGVLGPQHPDTLVYQLNATRNLVALDRPAEAARLLAQMEGPLLTWLGAELHATESAAVARDLVASQRSFQDVAVSLAVAHPEVAQAQEVAASALLRFKGLQAEEEAVIARLIRRGRDDAAGALAAEIRGLRSHLAQAFHGGAAPDELDGLTRTLDAKDRALGRLSRDYREQLKVREASLGDLQGALTGGATLVEFSRHRPADFEVGGFGPDRWAAVVVRGYDRLIAPLGLDPEAPVAGAPRSQADRVRRFADLGLPI